MFLFFGLGLGWPGGVLPGAASGLGLGLSNLGNVSASRDVAEGFSFHFGSAAASGFGLRPALRAAFLASPCTLESYLPAGPERGESGHALRALCLAAGADSTT